MEAFIATIMGWGPSWAPRGWSTCGGQLLAISQFSAVFSLIGTHYGGDGRTSFGLPDLRGRLPIGTGAGPGTSNYRIGEKAGHETVALNVNHMAPHNHSLALTDLESHQPASTAAADSEQPGATTVPALANFGVRSVVQNVKAYSTGAADTTLAPGTVSGTGTIGMAGGGSPFSVVQPVQAIQFIFCLEGIFPSRN